MFCFRDRPGPSLPEGDERDVLGADYHDLMVDHDLTSGVEQVVRRVVALEPDPSLLSAIGRGHSFESAIADLIDNSLNFGGQRIRVRYVTRHGFLERVRISDDGCGMTEDKLLDAMTLGRRREYEKGAQGHFGLGLKAASMSNCSELIVFTKSSNEPIHAARLLRNDLGGDFSVDLLHETGAQAGFNEGSLHSLDTTGTVVEWRRLDARSQAPDLEERRRWLGAQIESLRKHLGLIFHRKISSGAVRIEIEEYDDVVRASGAPRTVDPLDPFSFQLSGQKGYPKRISGVLPGGVPLTIECHILPPNSTSPSAKLMGRPRVDWQGLYIYRNDRLLQAGGWHSLLAENRPDWQLARAVIELDESLLDAVAINPEKRGVVLRPDFVHALEVGVAADGTTFRAFLEEARNVFRVANSRRPTGPQPVTPPGSGLPRVAVAEIHESLGVRDGEDPVHVGWVGLGEERLFLYEHGSRTISFNAGYRKALGDVDGLVVSVFLLVEEFFKSRQIRTGTLQKIEAWQKVIARTVLDGLAGKFDPLAGWNAPVENGLNEGSESELDLEATRDEPVADFSSRQRAVPSPSAVAQMIAEARRRAIEREQAALAASEAHEATSAPIIETAETLQDGGARDAEGPSLKVPTRPERAADDPFQRELRLEAGEAPELMDVTAEAAEVEDVIATETDGSEAPSEVVEAPATARKDVVATGDDGEAEIGSPAHLVELYRSGATLDAIATTSGLDVRDVARVLASLLVDAEADVDDESLAPRHGLVWEPNERDRAVAEYRAGVHVGAIAARLGRTPLAVAWQLLDSPRRPVAVSRRTVRVLRRAAEGRRRIDGTTAG